MSSTELAGIATEAKKELSSAHDAATLKLIEEALASGVKISDDQVMRIWKLVDNSHIPGLTKFIIWVEDGNARAGYQHMLKHADEFKALGITQEQLAEVAEAATTVGHPGGTLGGGKKKPGRPIFGLYFHNQPLAVAISVGDNGFVVGMNRTSYDTFIKTTGLDSDFVKEFHSWPREA